MSPPEPPAEDALDAGATDSTSAASGVGCMHCGYELRGIDEAADCPECGRPVADSLPFDDATAAEIRATLAYLSSLEAALLAAVITHALLLAVLLTVDVGGNACVTVFVLLGSLIVYGALPIVADMGFLAIKSKLQRRSIPPPAGFAGSAWIPRLLTVFVLLPLISIALLATVPTVWGLMVLSAMPVVLAAAVLAIARRHVWLRPLRDRSRCLHQLHQSPGYARSRAISEVVTIVGVVGMGVVEAVGHLRLMAVNQLVPVLIAFAGLAVIGVLSTLGHWLIAILDGRRGGIGRVINIGWLLRMNILDRESWIGRAATVTRQVDDAP